MTPADKDIQNLSDRLGLIGPIHFPQDWGICNANAGRTGEFIQVCRSEELTTPQQYAMGELVLASMNEALEDGVTDAELVSKFKKFMTLDLHGLASQIRYWASLANGEEFPISGLIERELMTST